MKGKYRNKKELERILKEVIAGKLTKIEAALITGYTRQHIYWLERRYKKEGFNGLIHKNTGRSPVNKIDDETKEWIVEQYKSWCIGFNFKLYQRKLKEKTGRAFSYHLIHDTLRTAGIIPPVPHKAGKKNEHPSRPRKEREGELIQIDATPFQWFKKWGDTQYYALHGAIDDATGKMVAMYMTRFENTHGYFEIVRRIFRKYGKPVAFYSDKSGIFHPTNKAEPTIEEQLQGYTKARTQWEKVMEDVGVASILANSPQAKGRIEHSWGPHHQYLLFDIQNKGWKTIKDVNEHLGEYIERYNAMFAKKQQGDIAAWRKAEHGWEEKICKRYIRIVDSGNCISFKNFRLLIGEPVKRNAKVEIRISENNIWARYNNKKYTLMPINSSNKPQKAIRYIIDNELYQDEKCG